MSQWHCVQQVVIRSIGDDTLMQRKSVSKLTFAFDPEALFCPHRRIHQLVKCVALRVLKVQRDRLASTKRKNTLRTIDSYGTKTSPSPMHAIESLLPPSVVASRDRLFAEESLGARSVSVSGPLDSAACCDEVHQA